MSAYQGCGMSIQAVAWALEQNLPARPKLVLVSIANHADHTSGYCWLKAETIATEAACTPRAVYNFVGDLIRNGFVRKALRKGDDGKQRATDYWILFNRSPDAVWIKDRQPGEEVEDDTISSEPHEQHSAGYNELEAPSEPVDIPAGSSGPHESTFLRKSLDSSEPSKTNPKSDSVPDFSAAPRTYRAPPIAPEVQGSTSTEIPQRVFVYVGTRAWEAWLDHNKRTRGMRSNPTTRSFIEKVGWRDGWYFPSLFPPSPEEKKESTEEGRAQAPPLKKPA